MPNYCVNKNAQSTGEHEVHKDTCTFLPDKENRINLGSCITCQEAIVKARKYYDNVDGCFYCIPECNKK